ncbi:MAG TPA: hypothetical protein PK948_05010 [Gemmatimonadales bacterium]|nr:hypothetical protein [Gemmatimonadales bacterium]
MKIEITGGYGTCRTHPGEHLWQSLTCVEFVQSAAVVPAPMSGEAQNHAPETGRSAYGPHWRDRPVHSDYSIAEAEAQLRADGIDPDAAAQEAVAYVRNKTGGKYPIGGDRSQLLRRLAQEWLDRNSQSPIHQATVDAFAAGNALMEALDMYAAQVSEVRSLRERWLADARQNTDLHTKAMKKLDDDWSAARKAALDEAAMWERRAKSAVIEAETNMVQIERLRDIAALQLNGLMEIRQLAALGEPSTVIQEKISATIGESLRMSMVAQPLSAEIGRYPALGTCGGDTMHDGSALHPQCSLYSWRRAEKEAGR